MANNKIVRGLTSGELKDAHWIYGDNIDFSRTRIHCGKYAIWQPNDTAMAPDGNIYFPPPIYKPDFSTSAGDMSLLIHELAHVWQVQSGLWLKLNRVLQGGVYKYGKIRPEFLLATYTVEQQASIIADWYRIRHKLPPYHGTGQAAEYESIVRAAIPLEK